MTPTQAIKLECKHCLNISDQKKIARCADKSCKLNDKTISSFKRIKAHCMTCIPEHTYQGAKSCDGKLLAGRMCDLHPFRLGKNPNAKITKRTPEQIEEFRQRVLKSGTWAKSTGLK